MWMSSGKNKIFFEVLWASLWTCNQKEKHVLAYIKVCALYMNLDGPKSCITNFWKKVGPRIEKWPEPGFQAENGSKMVRALFKRPYLEI